MALFCGVGEGDIDGLFVFLRFVNYICSYRAPATCFGALYLRILGLWKR